MIFWNPLGLSFLKPKLPWRSQRGEGWEELYDQWPKGWYKEIEKGGLILFHHSMQPKERVRGMENAGHPFYGARIR